MGLSFCTLAPAAIQLSEYAHLNVLGEVEFVYANNIFLRSSNEVADRYLIFSPGVELKLADQGAASALLIYKHHFTFYRDFSDLDGDYADLQLSVRYNSGVLLTTAYASYQELFSNTLDVNLLGDLIEREQTTIGASARYEVSELTAFRVGLDYWDVDYDRATYTDYNTISIPLTLYYSIRPKIDLTGGFRYRETDTDVSGAASYDSRDYYYFIGALGELFSPVIHADLSVGYQRREFKGSLDDTSSLSYDITFIYTGDAKTTLYAGFARDYRTSAIGGASYAFTNSTVGARYRLTRTLGFSAAMTYGESNYRSSPRAEDIVILNLGATYQPNDYLTLKASYEHTDVDGNNRAGAANYTNNEFRVSASLRY